MQRSTALTPSRRKFEGLLRDGPGFGVESVEGVLRVWGFVKVLVWVRCVGFGVWGLGFRMWAVGVRNWGVGHLTRPVRTLECLGSVVCVCSRGYGGYRVHQLIER